ncbi:hypothetical protein ACFOEE_06470 [Pseudoalteromonas fenneropenaei]|uniref:Uncharacterized protein n=1 Tax=Pseudoalteromonas fenneropenaei TaxID=1737459 RepID=A0ABV7CHT5_9GAMM
MKSPNITGLEFFKKSSEILEKVREITKKTDQYFDALSFVAFASKFVFLLIFSSSISANSLSEEIVFSKIKLKQATVSYTSAMQGCFENVRKIKVSDLDLGKVEVEEAVIAVNYFHYVALNECMKSDYVTFLKAAEYYRKTSNSADIGARDFVLDTWTEELRAEYEFRQLPSQTQNHFLKMEILRAPFDVVSLVIELRGE